MILGQLARPGFVLNRIRDPQAALCGDVECRRFRYTAPMPDAAATVPLSRLATRFRGFLPVVVDVETGGFDWNRHALLEIAVAPIDLDENGR